MAEGFTIEPQKQGTVHVDMLGLIRAYTKRDTRGTLPEVHTESQNVDNASAPQVNNQRAAILYNGKNAGESNAATAEISCNPFNSRPGNAKSDETEEKICHSLIMASQPTTDEHSQTMRFGPDILDPPTTCSSDLTDKADCNADNFLPDAPKRAGTYLECSENQQHDCDPEETPEIYESHGSDIPNASSDVIERCFSSEQTDIKWTKEEFFDVHQSPQLEEQHAQEKFYDTLESLESVKKADLPLSLPDVGLSVAENDEYFKRESDNHVVFKWETAVIPPKYYKISLVDKKPPHQIPILPDLESRKLLCNDVSSWASGIITNNSFEVSWYDPKVTTKPIDDEKVEHCHGTFISGLKPGTTYTIHVKAVYSSMEPVDRYEEITENVEVDKVKMEFYGLCRDFGFRAPLFNMQQGMGNIWRDTKALSIKHYAMFKGRNKRKKIFTETHNDLKNPRQDNMQEIFHEVCSVFEEGPAEIGLMQPPENSKGNERNGNKYKRQPRDVLADGIVSDLASDPPGQQSLYIPPGDNRRESYRLSTFEQFPSRVVVAANLAKHGFVYTGFYDRVKCFSCGRTVERWEAGDNPMDRKWHKSDCPFAQGIPTGNIPIGSFFSQSVATSFRSTNNQQPMEVAPSYTSQIMNGPVMRIPTDVPGTASTFQIQPGSSVVIGSSNPPARQNPPPSRPPATSRPANPPASAPRRGWRMANVISADHKRHLTNLYLNRELDRLASFGRWPTGRPNVSPVALARAAFFYLGDMDRTQCFSCGGVLRNWSYEDDAMEEHRTHFANCRFVVGTERRNVPIPNRPETPQELADKFPCRFPMNPHMRSEASRLGTFDRRWQMNRIRAKPHEIAEAGFFFLGERDRVKCWYCNGGLQNWEYDDIPWVEHAKWFPNCQFMLQRQGQLFIYRYLSLNPHLPRPIIGRQDGSTIDPVVTPPVGQSARVQDIPPQEPRARAPTPPPTIIDPQEEVRKRHERVEREMQNSETVKFVVLMGYAADTVRRVLREKMESGTAFDAENIFEGTSALLDAVMKMEEEIEKEEQATNIKFHTAYQNPGASVMESMETAPSLGQTSGVFQVSDFNHDSDDEERDLYGSITENATNGLSAGAVGVSTNGPNSSGYIGALSSGPISLGGDARPSMLGAPEDPESLKEFIEQKKEERLCKICFTENADMVFIPCSHMVCCKTCTEAIRQCPVCRTKIEKAIKTYIK